jgi:hypothetical protein
MFQDVSNTARALALPDVVSHYMKINPAARKALKLSIDDDTFYEHEENYDGLCFACGEWTEGGLRA